MEPKDDPTKEGLLPGGGSLEEEGKSGATPTDTSGSDAGGADAGGVGIGVDGGGGGG